MSDGVLMKKEKEIIIGAWLLNLHKYVPDILPKDKNEAICYYHFLHLLDDMFSGKIHVDNYHSLFLCQQTLIEDYGGRAIHFQNYLNRLFFRLGHTFSLNKRKCEVFNYFYYFHHKLLQIFEKEYKYNEFRIIKFPYCEHKYNKKTMYQIPYKEACHFGSNEYNLIELDKLYIIVNKQHNERFFATTNNDLNETIINKIDTGFIYLESLNELKEFTIKSNTQRRAIEKQSVISLLSKPFMPHMKLNLREAGYEYIEDKMVLNISALEAEIEKLTDNNDSKFDLVTLHRILFAYKNNIPLVYRSKKKGLRLTNIAEGLSVNLQGLKKEIRKKLFKGFYDYDIEAAAPTIMYQLYQQAYPDSPKLEHIEKYITNKHIYRKALAIIIRKQSNITDEADAIKKAKAIYTAILFGANALSKKSTLNLNYKIQKSMTASPFVGGLILDIKQIFRGMNEYYKPKRKLIDKETKTYEFYNPFGLAISIEKWSIKRVLAYIYQSIERHILDLVCEQYKNEIILRIHDGFITNKELKIEELEDYIEAKTKFRIKYEFNIL